MYVWNQQESGMTRARKTIFGWLGLAGIATYLLSCSFAETADDSGGGEAGADAQGGSVDSGGQGGRGPGGTAASANSGTAAGTTSTQAGEGGGTVTGAGGDGGSAETTAGDSNGGEAGNLANAGSDNGSAGDSGQAGAAPDPGAAGAAGAAGTGSGVCEIAEGGVSSAPPQAITGSGVFFSGQDMSIQQLEAGDEMPGYAYLLAGDTEGAPPIEAVDDASLPPGTQYAFKIDVPPVEDNIIFGWNWRQDVGDGWNWYDASAFAGIRFWAIALKEICIEVFVYDAFNLGTEDVSTTMCQAVSTDECEPIRRFVIGVGPEWRQFVLPFASFSAEGAVAGSGIDTSTLGRVDLIFSDDSSDGFLMGVTGIGLVTESEL